MKLSIPILGCLIAVQTATAVTAAAAPGRERSFDSNWRVLRADDAGAEAPDFDDTAWRLLDLPHDWKIEDLLPLVASTPELPVVTGQSRFRGIYTAGMQLVRVGPFDAAQSRSRWRKSHNHRLQNLLTAMLHARSSSALLAMFRRVNWRKCA